MPVLTSSAACPNRSGHNPETPVSFGYMLFNFLATAASSHGSDGENMIPIACPDLCIATMTLTRIVKI